MSKYANKTSRLISIQVISIFILVVAVAVMVTAISQRAKYEKQIEEINANHEYEIDSLRAELRQYYETQIAGLKQYYEYGGDVSQIEREAEYIAKVLYGVARTHEESDKRAVVWCILNRVEHHAHPNTIEGVCEQPKQWMGYSSENPILSTLYDLALAELKIWYGDGHRPVSNEYVYLSWSSKEILLRDTFEENKSTRYWRMN